MVIVNLRLSFELGLHIADMCMLEFCTCLPSKENHFCQKTHVPHLYDDKDDNSCGLYPFPLFKPEV